jgi:hypothetical protein
MAGKVDREMSNREWEQEIDETLAENIGKLCVLFLVVSSVGLEANDAWCELPLLQEKDIREPLNRIDDMCAAFTACLTKEIELLRAAQKKRKVSS